MKRRGREKEGEREGGRVMLVVEVMTEAEAKHPDHRQSREGEASASQHLRVSADDQTENTSAIRQGRRRRASQRVPLRGSSFPQVPDA